ncbi:MAG: VWA domain-containing protein [Holophagales bacterium]|nr:VWA domain-containing protein [Holophagales bacterium]MYC09339.1 VWA domain-containing protein [Holophagales bacterium]
MTFAANRVRAVGVLVLAAFLLPALAAAQEPEWRLAEWTAHEREFFLDGPQFLLPPAELERVRNLDPASRLEYIDAFLGRGSVAEAVEHRRQRVRMAGLPFFDVRARLLFLHGEPDGIDPVDCDQTFRPLQLWRYGPEEGEHTNLVLFQPKPNEVFRLWLPEDTKRALYMPEMEYFLEQYEELRGLLRARRFDLQVCEEARRVDEITGIRGLFGFRRDRRTDEDFLAWLAPPAEVEAWAGEAASDVVPGPAPLELEDPILTFPEQRGQRILARILLSLPPGAPVEPFVDDAGRQQTRINVEGMVELPGQVFDTFKMRFVGSAPEPDRSLALPVEQLFRPGSVLLLRLFVRDEVGGAAAFASVPVEVPLMPTAAPVEPEDQLRLVMAADDLPETVLDARNAIMLVPPESEVVIGLWRADTLITGDNIVAVRFLVDDRVQVTRRRPPFTAEVRLAKYPEEQVVRVEGLNAEREVVDADEIVLNQQRGELRVTINEPRRGARVSGTVEAVATVVVPEERLVQEVEFSVDGEVQTVLSRPPWRAEVEVPAGVGEQDLVYLTIAATLDDGSRAEDVRFLNAPAFTETLEVDLVELYTTVVDGQNRPVTSLGESDFTVFEDGRRQELAKFELVEDLPLTLGVVIDTSGSMETSLGEARRTASQFLANMITPRDRSFAVAFATRPELLIGRTSDVSAVALSIERLRAAGATALHDALITSLYYFRGVRGRRALVLLSDGEDTSSSVDYRDAEEYARRSGVAIYTIGLGVGRTQMILRNKLSDLAKVTGGRSFFISRAEDLAPVYGDIERELRSQYLLAYTSDRGGEGEEYREVEVRVKGRYKARTISGYYP